MVAYCTRVFWIRNTTQEHILTEWYNYTNFTFTRLRLYFFLKRAPRFASFPFDETPSSRQVLQPQKRKVNQNQSQAVREEKARKKLQNLFPKKEAIKPKSKKTVQLQYCSLFRLNYCSNIHMSDSCLRLAKLCTTARLIFNHRATCLSLNTTMGSCDIASHLMVYNFFCSTFPPRYLSKIENNQPEKST